MPPPPQKSCLSPRLLDTQRTGSVAVLTDFPRITESQQVIFRVGSVSGGAAVSYLGQVMDGQGKVLMNFVNQEQYTLRLVVLSRHSHKKKYRVLVDQETERNDVKGTRRCWCVCLTGYRTYRTNSVK